MNNRLFPQPIMRNVKDRKLPSASVALIGAALGFVFGYAVCLLTT